MTFSKMLKFQEEFYGRSLILADRELVEQGADDILSNADNVDVALLVVGDPFGATTHTDLIIRAKEKGIRFQVVHNASILNAVGCCGLQLYSFGETISIPYWSDTWRPDSFYDKIKVNVANNFHTLCLLGEFLPKLTTFSHRMHFYKWSQLIFTEYFFSHLSFDRYSCKRANIRIVDEEKT